MAAQRMQCEESSVMSCQSRCNVRIILMSDGFVRFLLDPETSSGILLLGIYKEEMAG
jgi:hypothetical protein